MTKAKFSMMMKEKGEQHGEIELGSDEVLAKKIYDASVCSSEVLWPRGIQITFVKEEDGGRYHWAMAADREEWWLASRTDNDAETRFIDFMIGGIEFSAMITDGSGISIRRMNPGFTQDIDICSIISREPGSASLVVENGEDQFITIKRDGEYEIDADDIIDRMK